MAELNGMISSQSTQELTHTPITDPAEHEHAQTQVQPQATRTEPEIVLVLEQEQELELIQAPAQTNAEVPLEQEQEVEAPPPTGVTLPQEQGTTTQTTLKFPSQELFADDRRTDFINICIPLYEASIKGVWKDAQVILERPDHGYLVRCSITDNCETMLHVAASAQSVDFVEKLVDVMQNDEDLLYQNNGGNTALCLAAITGNVVIATIMVTRNRNLLTICNSNNVTPLYMAALYGNRDMVSYLYNEMAFGELANDPKRWIYSKCVENDLFDTALHIFEDHQAVALEATQNVLGILARTPSALNELRQPIIRRIINSIICCSTLRHTPKESEAMILLRKILESIHEKPMDEVNRILRGPVLTSIGPGQTRVRTNPSRVLFVAAEKGNTKFIVELIRKYPDLIWKQNDAKVSLFHVAVSHRHQDIYNLLHEIGSMKELIVVLKDKDDNTMLHYLIGKKLEKSQIQDVSGAAFQMQRELLWYKEVESMLPPSYRERKNIRGLTPYELFTNTHKDLLYDGEKWMRGTASKCMLVATLIATIVFGVAYTIPGGYDEKLGVPIFRHNVFFLVFVVLDAISLVLSSTSILVFLSILTSRYSQEDFISSLPKKLFVGLSMLFLSIITMMIAFSVSFYVLYRHKFIIIAGFISLLALIPIIAYAELQYPLLRDVYSSTFGSKRLFKPKKQMLYYRNPSA